MKKIIFAAALAALLASAGAASAQERRGDGWRRNAEITVHTSNGRTITAERGDQMFYRLLDRPYNFRPGMTYSYTDRCNRQGCVVFVFDGRNRRPVDRIFAPHLQHRAYAWRQARDFDGGYNRYGRYDRDDRNWNNDDDRQYRDERTGRGDRSDGPSYTPPRAGNQNPTPSYTPPRAGADRDPRYDGRRGGDSSGLRGGPL